MSDLTTNLFMAIAFGTTCIFPIDTIKTRLQSSSGVYRGPIDCAQKIYASGGIRSFYAGLVPNLIGVTPEKAIKLVLSLLRLSIGGLTDLTALLLHPYSQQMNFSVNILRKKMVRLSCNMKYCQVHWLVSVRFVISLIDRASPPSQPDHHSQVIATNPMEITKIRMQM
jgi:hypothetical protein